jgi:hypothetical protein
MKLNFFITIAAIIGFIFGLGFLLIPDFVMGLYGDTLDPHFRFVCRYFGDALLGLAVTWWAARNTESLEAIVKAGLLGGLVFSVLGFVVSLWNALSGIDNNFVWINPIIFAFLTAGFARFYFKKAA